MRHATIMVRAGAEKRAERRRQMVPTASRALLLLVLAHGALGYQSPVIVPFRANQYMRSRRAIMKPSDLSRTLFGDARKAPIRSVIKDQFSKKTIGLCPPDLIDPVLDEMFRLLEKSSASSGGLEKLLLIKPRPLPYPYLPEPVRSDYEEE